jgi:hypothetical protein
MLMEVTESKFFVTVAIPSGPFRGRMVDKFE